MTSCLLCRGSRYVVVGRRAAGGEPRLTVVCRDCGLIYVRQPQKEPADSAKHYAVSEPSAEHVAKAERRGVEIEVWIREVCSPWSRGTLISENARILDVGSGNGGVLKVFRDRYGCDVLCVEPEADFAKYANDVLGVRTLSAPYETLSIDGTYDVILMSHTIMCFSRPDEILRDLARVLAPGGVLYLSVGNYYRPKRFGGLEQYLFKPYASYYFTPLTLQNLLRMSAFRAVAVDLTSRGEVRVLATRMSPNEAGPHDALRREHWLKVVLLLKLYDWQSVCCRVARGFSRLGRAVARRQWRPAR